jgi:hydroxymethylbilane synthase
MKRRVVLGTRGSALARWQADHVAGRLREAGHEVVVEVIRTTGDANAAAALPELGGKAAFTKEIQEALLDGRIDIAVHSLKDVAVVPVPGLRVAAFPERADARDAWVSRDGRPFAELSQGDVVGTGSLRRRAQILHRFPGVSVEGIRGNVGTRLRRLREGDMTGIVLAMAGLHRLGLARAVTQALDPDLLLPSPGQGAIGIEARDEPGVDALLGPLDHGATRRAVTAERALLARLEGGCLVPIGAWAVERGGGLHLDGLIASPDGRRYVRRAASGAPGDGAALGERLAETLLAEGGAEILADLESGSP